MLNGSKKFEVEDFAPAAFFNIRKRFSWSTESFLAGFCDQPLLGGGVGEGKSGSLFFASSNGDFISKTVTTLELEFFLRILQSYYSHIISEGKSSLLPRFMGLFKLKLPHQKHHTFVVMNNAFQISSELHRCTIEEKYDLKGSLRNRRVSEAEIEAGTEVLKDVNFVQRHASEEANSKVRLGAQLRAAFVEQMAKDVKWLQDNNIMDYSLLLGIAQTDADSTEGGGSMQQLPYRGFSILSSVDAPYIYFLSIIDILQEYNLKKKAESSYKTKVLRRDPYELSAIEPIAYGNRFSAFMLKEVFESYDDGGK